MPLEITTINWTYLGLRFTKFNRTQKILIKEITITLTFDSHIIGARDKVLALVVDGYTSHHIGVTRVYDGLDCGERLQIRRARKLGHQIFWLDI